MVCTEQKRGISSSAFWSFCSSDGSYLVSFSKGGLSMFSSPLIPFLHQVGMQSSFLVHWVIFPQTWYEKMVNQFHAVSFKREMSAVSLKRVHCDFFASHKEFQLDSRHHSDKFFILLKRNGRIHKYRKKSTFQN